MEILEVAKKLNAGKHHSARNDDVFIDRLNHRYTVTMILLFAAIVTTQQYFGSPITCWVPAQFTNSYEKYANDICWIMNTYYVPMEHDIPHAETTRYERMLKYYQWSPLILLLMALCFYFPHMIWRSLNDKSGLDIEKLVKQAIDHDKKDDSSDESKESTTDSKKSTTESKDPPTAPKVTLTDREKAIDYIFNSIRVYIENRYSTSDSHPNRTNSVPRKVWYYFAFWRHRHLSAYIVLLFTFVKLLFVVNSLVQIFLLNAFLGNEYHLFGFDVINKFMQGLDWGESRRFPRVTLCDFHIREVGIVHRYTVQCVLPINLFNEKIFLILWFWIILLTAFNLCDFIAWLFRIVHVDSRSAYVRRKLMMKNALAAGHGELGEQQRLDEEANIKNFVRNYLQEDGCFALRLLARNGQDIIVGDVIDKLYDHFCKLNGSSRLNTDHSINHSRDSSPNTLSRPVATSRSLPFESSPNEEERQSFV